MIFSTPPWADAIAEAGYASYWGATERAEVITRDGETVAHITPRVQAARPENAELPYDVTLVVEGTTDAWGRDGTHHDADDPEVIAHILADLDGRRAAACVVGALDAQVDAELERRMAAQGHTSVKDYVQDPRNRHLLHSDD